ncbi:unnamed protein product [Cylicocyclus nassatus]|uniref:Uncharacterized protein n=1 Tax=Cylicocyclus nassatus TaxID=53992 RepID=A0AA36MDI3_CYLNA|nr:unnamed protein product [Cylicocyclus nassatus]
MEAFACFDDMIVYQSEQQYSSNRFKILVIGTKGSGRSSLVRRFKSNTFEKTKNETDLSEVVVLVRAIQGYIAKADVQIAELSTFVADGDDKSSPVKVHNAKNYLDVNGVLLLYDMTNATAFEEVTDALSALQKMVAPDVDIYLVGTKSDLIDARAITFEEAEERAEKLGYSLFETSAVTGKNCEELLVEVLDRLAERRAAAQEYYREKKQNKKNEKESKEGVNEAKMDGNEIKEEEQVMEKATAVPDTESIKPNFFCWIPAFWKRRA